MSIDEIIQLANDHGYTGGDSELRAAIQAYANSERVDAENSIINQCDNECPTHGCRLTPVRSVTGVMTAYCSLERVVLSAQLSNTQAERKIP